MAPYGLPGISMQISARNQIPGTVTTITKGPVNTEVVVALNGVLQSDSA